MPLARKDLEIWPAKVEIAVRKISILENRIFGNLLFLRSSSDKTVLPSDEFYYRHDNFVIQSKSH